VVADTSTTLTVAAGRASAFGCVPQVTAIDPPGDDAAPPRVAATNDAPTGDDLGGGAESEEQG
jgi:hypothetical protein